MLFRVTGRRDYQRTGASWCVRMNPERIARVSSSGLSRNTHEEARCAVGGW